ncbi:MULTISPECIES: hypothetical protein [unclassified Microbacterium]|uniref:hypothetical protein n=1 Tax=unclassified Microbacterium TaxID=2609290 RepID=UPI000EAA0984|nr:MULTISPECIES: hypothetical protein [unclassified Microbacterium]MBT2485918.1 hypothetical protein [Microbacterium sp. ISL-108]RKN68671.1 hypothetical protein D7252_14505 [Microbacterium sp. CGR2]
MTPDDVVAAATVAGVIVAALFGLTGFVVGLVSLNHARKARESAAGANLIAKDSNIIAVNANALSSEANTIAREANDLARLSDVRATEQHDVTWDCSWRAPGVYAVRNEGKQAAHRVWIQITIDDEVEEANLEVVEGGETVLLEMPNAKAAWDAEKRAEEERRQPRRSGGILGGINVPSFAMPAMNYHFNRDRILWRTELGTPKEHDKSFNMGSVGP